MINMTNLSVSADYSRYHGTGKSDHFLIARPTHATQICETRWPSIEVDVQVLCFLARCFGEWYNQLKRKQFDSCCRLARAKSHPIFSDIELNTNDVVYLNVYQNFLLCAYKMHSYLRNWGLSAKKNAAFIHGTPVHQLLLGSDYRAIPRRCAEHDPCFLLNHTEQSCGEETDDKWSRAYTQSGRNLVCHTSSIELVVTNRSGLAPTHSTWCWVESHNAMHHCYDHCPLNFRSRATDATGNDFAVWSRKAKLVCRRLFCDPAYCTGTYCMKLGSGKWHIFDQHLLPQVTTYITYSGAIWYR